MCLQDNEELPELFVDPAYNLSCHWTLSTSQIPTDYFEGYGWGEVVPDGFGVAYMVKDNRLHFNVTGLCGDCVPDVDNSHTWSQQSLASFKLNRVKMFCQYLKQSLDDLRRIFELTKEDALAIKEVPLKSPTATASIINRSEGNVSANSGNKIFRKGSSHIERRPSSIRSATESGNRLGFTLAYPTRQESGNLYAAPDGVIGEDVGFIELDWGETRTEGVYSRGKKILKMLGRTIGYE